MSVLSISYSSLSAAGLPKRLEKKFHNDKIKLIFLAIFTCGVALGVRAGVRAIKARLLNKFLLPAAFMDPSSIAPIVDPDAKSLFLPNKDGIKLDVTEVKTNSASQKWLVYFCGNGMVYQDAYEQLKEYAVDLGVNLLLFNYRGVGHSKGQPIGLSHLLTDGAACIEHLKKEHKAQEKDIVFFGFSLGGAVSTVLSSYYDSVNVFNFCSFGNSIKAVYHMCGKGLFGCIAVTIVVLTGTATSVGKYWQKIPSKRKAMAYHPLDGVIHKPASLYIGEKKRIRKKHPNYLVKKGGKLKLPKDKRPPCIKLQGGSDFVDTYNHGATDDKDRERILKALQKLFKN